MTDASLEPPLEAFDGGRRVLAEALGTAWLLATVVGSGIMAERLSLGNSGVALLANSLATGGSLFVLITIFGPLSGAHFNPAVSLAFAIRRELLAHDRRLCRRQFVGAVLGVFAAHAMFAEPIWQLSTSFATGPLNVLGGHRDLRADRDHPRTLRFRPAATAATVSLYIVAAYWFTASTSFANPAVTLARALSDTFAGIAPSSAPEFVGELFGAGVATLVCGWLFSPRRRVPTPA